MDDDHPSGFDAVEDQIVSMNATTNMMVLVAGDEGEASHNVVGYEDRNWLIKTHFEAAHSLP
ncbi:hypothetical protein A6U87_20825 [Rhizobium sp. AC44/96]|nr:hypothetical protein A6U87_20825 [Rhizobium sp. AC44/96]